MHRVLRADGDVFPLEEQVDAHAAGGEVDLLHVPDLDAAILHPSALLEPGRLLGDHVHDVLVFVRAGPREDRGEQEDPMT